jgi:hypothetical protein
VLILGRWKDHNNFIINLISQESLGVVGTNLETLRIVRLNNTTFICCGDPSKLYQALSNEIISSLAVIQVMELGRLVFEDRILYKIGKGILNYRPIFYLSCESLEKFDWWVNIVRPMMVEEMDEDFEIKPLMVDELVLNLTYHSLKNLREPIHSMRSVALRHEKTGKYLGIETGYLMRYATLVKPPTRFYIGSSICENGEVLLTGKGIFIISKSSLGFLEVDSFGYVSCQSKSSYSWTLLSIDSKIKRFPIFNGDRVMLMGEDPKGMKANEKWVTYTEAPDVWIVESLEK